MLRTQLKKKLDSPKTRWALAVVLTPEEKDQIIRYIEGEHESAGAVLRKLLITAAEAKGFRKAAPEPVRSSIFDKKPPPD